MIGDIDNHSIEMISDSVDLHTIRSFLMMFLSVLRKGKKEINTRDISSVAGCSSLARRTRGTRVEIWQQIYLGFGFLEGA